jgi:hypothetical protein
VQRKRTTEKKKTWYEQLKLALDEIFSNEKPPRKDKNERR